MAIKIPSKNIYEIDNPKIRDNMIDNVSVEQTVITPNNDYETPIHNAEIYISDNDLVNGAEQSPSISAYSSNYEIYGYPISFALAYFSQPKYINVDLKIPILKENKYISKIIDGIDDNNNSNIKYSLYGDIEEGTTTATVSNVSWSNVNNNTSLLNTATITIDYQNASKTIIEDTNYTISNKIETTGLATVVGGYNASATSILETEENIKEKLFTLSNDGNYYVANLKILCGIIEIYSRGGSSDSYKPTSFTVSRVYYKKYIPKQIEITIYGNTIGIDLTDSSVTYGNGNKPYSLSRNELLQDSANSKDMKTDIVDVTIGGDLESYENTSYLEMYTSHNFNVGDIITNSDGTETAEITNAYSSDGYYEIRVITNGYFYQNMHKDVIIKYSYYQQERLTQHLANNVLSQYAKGKETATLLCSISDYYDESGEKVIDTKTNKMSFRLHDEVIPYVFGADGKDKPMSKYQDGSAKVFEVVGSNIIYDGAVWQELNLLEKT